MGDPEANAPGTGWRWGPPLLVILLTLAAYCNSLRGPFIFDDFDSIANNPQIRSLGTSFSTGDPGTTVAGRPILALSFALDYAIAGNRVEIYHATNLLIHLGCALLLYGIVRRTLLRRENWGDRFANSADWLAAATAGIWAVHPLNTEAVTYLVQRAESLAGLFFLVVIYCLIRAAEKPRLRWFLGAVAACALGIGTKELVAISPIVALMYDRRFLSGSFSRALRARWALYGGLAATWAIFAILLAGGARGSSISFRSITPLDYARTQLDAVAHYLRLAIWPSTLVLDEYGWRLSKHWGDIRIGGWFVLLLGSATVILIWKNSWLGFVGAWVFLILAPSSSAVPIITEVVAEHRMYLPLMGMVVLGVVAFWAIAERWGVWWVSPVAAAMVIVVLMCRTLMRNVDYQTAEGIWRATIAQRPLNPRAHFNLAAALADGGRASEAAGEYREAFQLQPDYYAAAFKLGETLIAMKDFSGAQKVYGDLIAANAPTAALWRAHVMLGSIDVQQHNWPAAKSEFQSAIALKADDPQIHFHLGMVLEQMHDWKGAQSEFEQTLRLSPDDLTARGELDRVQVQLRQ